MRENRAGKGDGPRGGAATRESVDRSFAFVSFLFLLHSAIMLNLSCALG